MYFNNLFNRLRKYVHIRKRGQIAVRDLWKVTGVKNINLKDLAGLSPKFSPLHIDGMEKIQDFPVWGKLLTEK